jgi:TPR repeat protein
LGRALLANNDSKGAKQEFELAASRGYRAAGIDLANIDPAHAIALNERAWKDGVAIAAYELGRRYETGLPTAAIGEAGAQPDPVKAWYWYEKGADAGEPTALGRLGERDDTNALAETDRAKRNFLLLEAFRHYAAAVERAKQEDWPDDAWKSWRYRRASLARILAREGMMQEVADAYRAVMAQTTSTLNAWQSLKARLHL